MIAVSRGYRQSVYIPEDLLLELEAEAERLDRPLPWLVRRAWQIARAQVMAQPPGWAGVDDATPESGPR